MVITAAMYEELEGRDGWKDFIARVKHKRERFREDLLLGKYSSTRPKNLTDKEIRAMLFVLDGILDIPASAKAEYENWRKRTDAISKVKEAIASGE